MFTILILLMEKIAEKLHKIFRFSSNKIKKLQEFKKQRIVNH